MCPWLTRPLFLLLLAACAPLAHAQVYRCVGAQGEPVFSGQPCGTPMPAASAATPARHNGFGAECAATPQALQQSVAEAFAGHDVNRLAGLIDWQDIDQASARIALHALSEWLKQPLAGIAIAYAAGPPPVVQAPAPTAAAPVAAGSSAFVPAPPIGVEISTSGGNGSTRDFGVVVSGGCWWLTF
jgi:hypothetical protein